MLAVARLTQIANPLIQCTELFTEALFTCLYQSLGHFIEFVNVIFVMDVFLVILYTIVLRVDRARGHANLHAERSLVMRVIIARGHANRSGRVFNVWVILVGGHANLLIEFLAGNF